jgi:hypothetical protein
MESGQRLRRGRPLVLALVLAGLVALAAPGGALANTTLHVSTSGVDTGNCQSSPCHTLAYAVTQGEATNDLVTIDVAAGTYDQTLALSSADSGLTIAGVGNGSDPASSTILTDTTGSAPVLNATPPDAPSSVTLDNLRLTAPSTNAAPLFYGSTTELDLNDVAMVGHSTAPVDVSQDLLTSGGSMTDDNAGAAPVIDPTGDVSLDGTPISTAGGIAVDGVSASPVSVIDSPVTVTNTTSNAPAVIADTGSLTIVNSAITVADTGLAVDANGGPISISNSPVTMSNPATSAPAVANSGSGGTIGISGTTISYAGTALAVAASAPADLSNVTITMSNSGNGDPAVVFEGRGSTLSHVTIGGAWTGIGIDDTGSMSVADSTITSGPAPTGPMIEAQDGGPSGGSEISIVRTKVVDHSSSSAPAVAVDGNALVDSSLIIGGVDGIGFAAEGGNARQLTVISSTIDAGAPGVRDTTPIFSIDATTDSTSGSRALATVEGSILVEPPAATVDGAGTFSTLNCANTEVPSTTQVASGSNGTINCASGSNANTSTSSLSSIFAAPGTNYALNPSWSGVDSVPAAAISAPAPFSDSATDLLGNPRVLNGVGTCAAGLRDKGAIELTGHGGVVPAPRIAGPSKISAKAFANFTGSAPNVPAGVTTSYSWHSSDGGGGSASSYSHEFARPGKDTVSLTVRGAAGCTGTTSTTITVTGVDVISGLKLGASKFKASKGTAISYKASEPATTTFTVLVKGKNGKYTKVKTFKHTDRAGKVSLHLNSGGLSKGRYHLVAVSSNPAGKGPARTVSFTITG